MAKLDLVFVERALDIVSETLLLPQPTYTPAVNVVGDYDLRALATERNDATGSILALVRRFINQSTLPGSWNGSTGTW